MIMTPGEIVREYRQARDRQKILQVLADRCLCTQADIRELLDLYGETPPAPAGGPDHCTGRRKPMNNQSIDKEAPYACENHAV